MSTLLFLQCPRGNAAAPSSPDSATPSTSLWGVSTRHLSHPLRPHLIVLLNTNSRGFRCPTGVFLRVVYAQILRDERAACWDGVVLHHHSITDFPSVPGRPRPGRWLFFSRRRIIALHQTCLSFKVLENFGLIKTRVPLQQSPSSRSTSACRLLESLIVPFGPPPPPTPTTPIPPPNPRSYPPLPPPFASSPSSLVLGSTFLRSSLRSNEKPDVAPCDKMPPNQWHRTDISTTVTYLQHYISFVPALRTVQIAGGSALLWAYDKDRSAVHRRSTTRPTVSSLSLTPTGSSEPLESFHSHMHVFGTWHTAGEPREKPNRACKLHTEMPGSWD